MTRPKTSRPARAGDTAPASSTTPETRDGRARPRVKATTPPPQGERAADRRKRDQ